MCLDWEMSAVMYLIALRLLLLSITAYEFPKQTLTSPYQRVFAVKQQYKGLQLGIEGSLSQPCQTPPPPQRKEDGGPGCFF